MLLCMGAADTWLEGNVRSRYKKGLLAASNSLLILTLLTLNITLSLEAGLTRTWPQCAAATSALYALLSLPRRPIVYFQNHRVDNEDGASLLARLSFSWGIQHDASDTPPERYTLENLPGVAHNQRVATVEARFAKVTSDEQSLPARLVWAFKRQFAQQWGLVFVQAAMEFGSRWGMYRLLQSLEAAGGVRGGGDDDGYGEKGREMKMGAGVWVLAISVGLIAQNVASKWVLTVTQAKLQMPMISLIQMLLFRKMTRRQMGGEGEEESGTTSLSDMLSNDS